LPFSGNWKVLAQAGPSELPLSGNLEVLARHGLQAERGLKKVDALAWSMGAARTTWRTIVLEDVKLASLK
jgi:hypothetical protein